jgi:hypothetical protein
MMIHARWAVTVALTARYCFTLHTSGSDLIDLGGVGDDAGCSRWPTIQINKYGGMLLHLIDPRGCWTGKTNPISMDDVVVSVCTSEVLGTTR